MGMILRWLFIDTSQSGRVRFGLLDQKSSRLREIEGRSHVLLPALSRLKLSNVKGICVVEGPGSFSAVRGGVIVANILSRVLKCPLVGVRLSETEDMSALAKRLTNGEIVTRAYIEPIYDSEPNITVKKQIA
jgi:hypothetical protein